MLGKKINELTVLEIASKDKHGLKRYKCQCSCGKIKLIYESKLKQGQISCGCKKIEQFIANNKKKAAKNLAELIGQTFYDLTVLEEAERRSGKRRLKCQCSCGNIVIKDAYKLKKGVTKSCGCKRSELISEARTIHNGRNTTLYSKWSGIKRRCMNPHDSHYSDYGGRGITICEEWKNDFGAFKEWALANGYTDSLTIERKDINKGYEPSNCEWIAAERQAWNKQNSARVIYNGELQPITIIASLEKMNHKTLSSRYYRFKKRNPHIDVNMITFEMLTPNNKRK